ncbi:MAG: hypothetical protein QXS93_04290 [Candidatus Micrarchaeia archaeon]
MHKDVKRVTEEIINKGGLLFNMYFDSHANDEEGVKNRLTDLFAKITKEDGVVYAIGEIEPPIREEFDGKVIYSTSGSIKVLTKDARNAVRIAMAYGPVHCEVLEPEKRIITFAEIQDIMNDASQTSYALSQFIIRNTLKGEALQAFLHNIKLREQLGKELRKKGVNK